MKKSTMLACAGIVIVSFAPFLGGCACASIAAEPDAAPEVQEATIQTDSTFAIPAALDGEDPAFATLENHS